MLKISYSRGFPYGAPLALIRGGGTRDPQVKDYLQRMGFQWEGSPTFAWKSYMHADELRDVLKTCRDIYNCDVVPKSGIDPNYIIDLDWSKP